MDQAQRGALAQGARDRRTAARPRSATSPCAPDAGASALRAAAPWSEPCPSSSSSAERPRRGPGGARGPVPARRDGAALLEGASGTTQDLDLWSEPSTRADSAAARRAGGFYTAGSACNRRSGRGRPRTRGPGSALRARGVRRGVRAVARVRGRRRGSACRLSSASSRAARRRTPEGPGRASTSRSGPGSEARRTLAVSALADRVGAELGLGQLGRHPGDWKRRGSVEVTQFQRRVLSQAEKSRGSSKPFFPLPARPRRSGPGRRLPSPRGPRAPGPGRRRRGRRGGRASGPRGSAAGRLFDEVLPRADADDLAGLGRSRAHRWGLWHSNGQSKACGPRTTDRSGLMDHMDQTRRGVRHGFAGRGRVLVRTSLAGLPGLEGPSRTSTRGGRRGPPTLSRLEGPRMKPPTAAGYGAAQLEQVRRSLLQDWTLPSATAAS